MSLIWCKSETLKNCTSKASLNASKEWKFINPSEHHYTIQISKFKNFKSILHNVNNVSKHFGFGLLLSLPPRQMKPKHGYYPCHEIKLSKALFILILVLAYILINMPVRRGGGGCDGCDRTPLLEEIFFFFFFFFACVLVIEVGDVQIYPYPMSGKLTQIFWEGKKSVGVPPPCSSAFSGLARLSRLAADQ